VSVTVSDNTRFGAYDPRRPVSTDMCLESGVPYSVVLTVNSYRVTVFTGTRRHAGTDADVRITLFGNLGESGERKLDTKMKNNFEAGSYVSF